VPPSARTLHTRHEADEIMATKQADEPEATAQMSELDAQVAVVEGAVVGLEAAVATVQVPELRKPPGVVGKTAKGRATYWRKQQGQFLEAPKHLQALMNRMRKCFNDLEVARQATERLASKAMRRSWDAEREAKLEQAPGKLAAVADRARV